jgi:hypothetical protein
MVWGSAFLKYLQASSCIEKQSVWFITDQQHGARVLRSRRDEGFRKRCVQIRQTLLVIRLDLGSDFGGHHTLIPISP